MENIIEAATMDNGIISLVAYRVFKRANYLHERSKEIDNVVPFSACFKYASNEEKKRLAMINYIGE